VERIDSMFAHVQKLSTKGRGFFPFTDFPTLAAYKVNIMTLPWRSSAGETVRIAGQADSARPI
jgi:hypothetical protein